MYEVFKELIKISILNNHVNEGKDLLEGVILVLYMTRLHYFVQLWNFQTGHNEPLFSFYTEKTFRDSC